MLEARRVAARGLLLVPAGLVLYFAFNSGGFHPGAPAYAAVVLCVILAVRIGFAGNPLAGFGPALGLAAVALALFWLMSLVSGIWSHAPGVARTESDLPLVYLLVLLICGSIGYTRRRLRTLLRALAAASVVICVCGLVTRVLPHWWPTSTGFSDNRLSFPVTYWNVLGLVAAFGIVLCVHLSSDLREPPAVRVAGAAAVPLLAPTLFFTFSRGAIVACAIALVVYVVVGRPRGLVSSLLAIVPPAVVALKLSYDANLLATTSATSAPAVSQGRHLALALVGCAVGAAVVRAGLIAYLDSRLRRIRLPPPLGRRLAWAVVVSVGTAAIIAGFAFHGALVRDYHRFLSGAGPGSPTDFRSRLTDPANNGRVDMWTVAWRGFKSAPFLGHGAGSFADTWAQHRIDNGFIRDAHSLYLETLDELGIVGLALLLTVILTILIRVGSRARGPGRAHHAAALAVLLAWAVQAAFDWDWEMPVVTVVFFALGGLALGRRVSRAPDRSHRSALQARRYGPSRSRTVPGRAIAIRGAAAATLIATALLPGYVWASQTRLDDASYYFRRGDCALARAAARSSIAALGNRAEPYEILSYCDLRLRMPRDAVAAIGKAVSLDPKNWNYAYSLVVVRAAAGLDPRRAAQTALALNPRDALVRSAWHMFHSGTPAHWRPEAMAIAGALTTL